LRRLLLLVDQMVVERRREGDGEDDQKVTESMFDNDDDSWREKNLGKGRLVLLLCTQLCTPTIVTPILEFLV